MIYTISQPRRGNENGKNNKVNFNGLTFRYWLHDFFTINIGGFMETKNTELYYHTYDEKFGYQAEVFTNYNDALEFLNDHQENYVGSIHVSADRKLSGFSDMRDILPDYLKELESEEGHNEYLRRNYAQGGNQILSSLFNNIANNTGGI